MLEHDKSGGRGRPRHDLSKMAWGGGYILHVSPFAEERAVATVLHVAHLPPERKWQRRNVLRSHVETVSLSS